MRRGRRRLVTVALAVVAVIALGAAGGAWAMYRYDAARSSVILPGIRVAGVDVGGMTRDEAVAAVGRVIAAELARPLRIEAAGRTWRATHAELGERADVAGAVDRALAVGQTMTAFERAWHRLRDEPVAMDVQVPFSVVGGPIERLVDRIAAQVAIEPRDARIDLTADGSDIRFVRARPGRKLRVAAAEEKVLRAVRSDLRSVQLGTVRVEPKVTPRTLGRTIVVRVDENVLYLYDGFRVMKTWSVATAKPGWTTPTGVWTIWDKRVNPTWYNPALDSWGANLPAVVPGGPNGVMGTRAIYIDAPGLIRIHGTPAPESIGRYASHGCIRMRNEEIEELYELIPVGAHVIIAGYRPPGAQEWDTPAAADI